MSVLLKQVETGRHRLGSRLVMGPLTRSRATTPGDVPNEMMARYYAQRADPRTGAGLILSEATPISPQGRGYYATPGIHSADQIEGWKRVTAAVHERGTREQPAVIYCQLWHVGRVSNVALQPGGASPVGPTDAPSRSKTYVDESMERVPNSPPRALRADELPGIATDFAAAARNAIEAGFDGVQIHGANTYLLDQFTRDGMNTRTDEFGGSVESRIRFPLMVARAVADAIGADRVGYRISPLSEHHDAKDTDPGETFSALAAGLGSLGLAHLEAVESWDRSVVDERPTHALGTVIPRIRVAYKVALPAGARGIYIANGDYSPEAGAAALEAGHCDAVSFGKLFISNPDLAERIRRGGPFAEWDTATFYGGGAEGYTDYPVLDASAGPGG